MITIVNMARSMLLASVAVMAATGGASASSRAQEAVRAQVEALANAGTGAANSNKCETASTYIAKISGILKDSKINISIFEKNHTELEQEIQTKVAETLVSIQSCEARASASSQPAAQAKPTVAGNGTNAGSLKDGLAAEERGDWKAAFLLLEPLANQGNPIAQLHLGWMFETGKGVNHYVTSPDRLNVKDATQASIWYRKAAEQGNAQAQTGLGRTLKNAIGPNPAAYAEAMKWFRKAADQGDIDGQFDLAVMYYDGKGGVPQDYAEAMKWFRKAADQGDADAQTSIGVLYELGQGVPQNYAEAMKWYRKAADQGNADAPKYITRLSMQMQQDKIPKTKRAMSDAPQHNQPSASGSTNSGNPFGDVMRHNFFKCGGMTCD